MTITTPASRDRQGEFSSEMGYQLSQQRICQARPLFQSVMTEKYRRAESVHAYALR